MRPHRRKSRHFTHHSSVAPERTKPAGTTAPDAASPPGEGSRKERGSRPEPAKYGGTVTVTGRLTRANRETGRYAGSINQQAQLQFRDKNAGAYTTVRTVTSGTDGALRATVPALAEGSWRWVFAGTGTTGAATSTADYVVVKQPSPEHGPRAALVRAARGPWPLSRAAVAMAPS
ncbi:hypothetical protein ACFCYX_19785 [Streptomyces populi]|uniref:hypothetical protein n=1 Tax=Streptomyces populi TaxID=2058924 RepID=UPI0035E2B45E